MQALPHCRCWLSSNSSRQRPNSRGCSQLQGHPSRGEAVKDGTSQTVEENPQQEELLQQPAALADLDVEVSLLFTCSISAFCHLKPHGLWAAFT